VTQLGRPRLHLRRVGSTNERARALAAAGAPHGTVVTAGEQSAGRGRQGRTWTAPAGRALLMSVVLRDPPVLLPLVAAVATADALASRAMIKWPNDVLLDGRKVAGILAEGRFGERWAVLGVGVNVALREDELPERAGTLGLEPAAVEDVLVALLAALERRLGQPDAEVLRDWRERDALWGRAVRWRGGYGRAEGIDDAGRLLVAPPDGGLVALDAGEVHLVPPPEAAAGA
jgi:BirA family biotin operon repressor/biotin-[acetyl-CoA-carboxylase] ligase